uniref:EamA domain-containing protein n=1 Tax=Globisporangium ultimum (strain ATCC 200006 / CBS 805.95 / DAOM BR144) TaxID=431595 RepID=K3X9E0_GLOUD
MGDVVLGYAGALVAVFFFGTCYVPAKKYPTYDGIIFQWFMCSGILMVGIVWGLLSNNWSQFAEAGLYTFPEGILGGSLFGIANLLIPTVVNNLGLGVGFMLWNATNITMGYLISRYGLFGVEPTIPGNPTLSVLGIVFMIASIAVYGMITPTLSNPLLPNRAAELDTEFSPLLDDGGRSGANPYRSTLSKVIHRSSLTGAPMAAEESLQDALVHPELPNFGPFSMPAAVSEHVALVDSAAERKRKAVGGVIALLVGGFLSCCLVPYVNWQQSCTPSTSPETEGNSTNPQLHHDNNLVISTCNPLNFIFSQCLGIYLTSTVAFLLYSAFHRFVLKRSMPRSVMRPAYMCGVLWAIGLAGQLYSAGQLGFDQAYPVSSIGPAMVSMLWSACYFHEIQGKRNLLILAVATAMVITGTALRVVSM